MLREVKDAGFERVGSWPLRRWRFVAGRVHSPRRLRRARLSALLEIQGEQPVVLLDAGTRSYWAYADRFWWEDEGLEADDVRALAEERARRNHRRLERARAELVQAEEPRLRRAPVPRAVRRAVFDRDGGRCTQCGSSFDIQYDHVIPVALGGASGVENLELLCGDCNRRKGASL